MERLFRQNLIPATLLVLFLGFIAAMTIDIPHNNPFLTKDGQLSAELEFRDEQSGFVGISGITWAIFPDGTCQASRFVNKTVSPPHHTCHLTQQDRVALAKALSDQGFTELPSEISSQPTLNPHQFTIRWGQQSATLVLQAGQSIETALAAPLDQHPTLRSRFLTIAQTIDRLIQKQCEDN